jgi:hypothetical protein
MKVYRNTSPEETAAELAHQGYGEAMDKTIRVRVSAVLANALAAEAKMQRRKVSTLVRMILEDAVVAPKVQQ